MPISKQFKNYVQCRLIRHKSVLSQIFDLEIELLDKRKSVSVSLSVLLLASISKTNSFMFRYVC